MSTLRIHWHDEGTKDYEDIIPSTLFLDRQSKPQIHDVIGPNGGEHKAKFELRHDGGEWTFDYEKFQKFNKAQGVGIGQMKLRFRSPNSSGMPVVSWRDQGQDKFERCTATVTRDVAKIPIEISACPHPSSPFVKVTAGTPPKIGDFRRKLRRNSQPRQIWFEGQLNRIATSLRSAEVPWRFETPSGLRWQLDKGAVGHAMANEYLVTPSEAIALEKVRIRGWQSRSDSNARIEIERRKRQAKMLTRPGQQKFSRLVRDAYGNRCAVTGCETAAALEAAHIRVKKGRDFNDLNNGILLRADIHALFDGGLITLTRDGSRLEISDQLKDGTYAFLSMTQIFQPDFDSPSQENIEHHRRQFREINNQNQSGVAF
jgi:hypothetical protein